MKIAFSLLALLVFAFAANPLGPVLFDLRHSYPHCVQPIFYGSHCHAPAIFTVANALSFKLCMYTNGQIAGPLSPQYMISCSGYQCNAPPQSAATFYQFAAQYGLPTNDCVQYESSTGYIPACPKTCDFGDQMSVYRFAAPFKVAPEDLYTALQNYGPVTATMHVDMNFHNYRANTRYVLAGPAVDTVAVSVLGYGQDYLIVQIPYFSQESSIVYVDMARGGIDIHSYISSVPA